MKRAGHQPFSPDLALSDFCLFGKLKTALTSEQFGDERRVFDGTMSVLDTISRDGREATFDEWLMRACGIGQIDQTRVHFPISLLFLDAKS
jgi:hypothetical protein